MKAASWCKWLAMRYKAHLTNQPERPDGVKVATLVGNFRADFRLALIMTVVRRAAAMQLGSGLPSGSIRGSYAWASKFIRTRVCLGRPGMMTYFRM